MAASCAARNFSGSVVACVSPAATSACCKSTEGLDGETAGAATDEAGIAVVSVGTMVVTDVVACSSLTEAMISTGAATSAGATTSLGATDSAGAATSVDAMISIGAVTSTGLAG